MKTLPLLFVVLAGLISAPAHAEIDCKMSFTLKGWSAFYKRSSGNGVISCNNGQSMRVSLEARGGGLSIGRSTIKDGKGEFSGVDSINELIGTYASAEAHAGAVKSAKGQVVVKEDVSLALSGTGKGWDLGVAIGSFIIRRR